MVRGRDREGCATAAVVCGRGYGKAPHMYFWEGLSPKERVALRTTRGLADVRLAAMLVCLVCDMLGSVGERRGRNINAICEEGKTELVREGKEH